MKRDTIISGVLYGVFFAALAGFVWLPKPYSTYAHTLWVFWFAAMGGYGFSLKSRKPKLELIRNAVIVAVVIAGIAMLRHNAPVQEPDYPAPIGDPSDVRVIEYPEHTFQETCTMAVLLFAKVSLGAMFGIWAAFAMGKNATEPTD